MEINEFVIRAKLPGLNEYTKACRTHWSRGAAMKAEVEEIIMVSIALAKRQGRCRHVDGPCGVAFFWHEKNARRDPDNIFSAKKYILDAMQKSGILDGDGQKHISGLYDTIVSDTETFVEVKITQGKRRRMRVVRRRIWKDEKSGAQTAMVTDGRRE